MPLIETNDAVTFDIPGVTFTSLASPSKGSRENSVWRVRLHPHSPAHPHQLTREEIFVVTNGSALASVDGITHELSYGATLIVPANTSFSLSNPYDEPFEALVIFPIGGLAIIGNDPPFTPPWAM